jgi:hypothetical protein
MRIGGYSYSVEYDIERRYRDAMLMCIGEGTNEILRTVIAKQLIDRTRQVSPIAVWSALDQAAGVEVRQLRLCVVVGDQALDSASDHEHGQDGGSGKH